MNTDLLLKLYPNASQSTIKANEQFEARNPRLRADNPQPAQRLPLVSPAPGEETRWYGAAERFEITFRIYSQRPCDWDGYSIKEIQDMLVHAGLLSSDKWSALCGRVESCKARSQEEERTEIEITPMSLSSANHAEIRIEKV